MFEFLEQFTIRCICYFSRCWLYWDRAQNMLIWGRRCSTPLKEKEKSKSSKTSNWFAIFISLWNSIRIHVHCYYFHYRLAHGLAHRMNHLIIEVWLERYNKLPDCLWTDLKRNIYTGCTIRPWKKKNMFCGWNRL